jgi:hypothetical protein
MSGLLNFLKWSAIFSGLITFSKLSPLNLADRVIVIVGDIFDNPPTLSYGFGA